MPYHPACPAGVCCSSSTLGLVLPPGAQNQPARVQDTPLPSPQATAPPTAMGDPRGLRGVHRQEAPWHGQQVHVCPPPPLLQICSAASAPPRREGQGGGCPTGRTGHNPERLRRQGHGAGRGQGWDLGAASLGFTEKTQILRSEVEEGNLGVWDGHRYTDPHGY